MALQDGEIVGLNKDVHFIIPDVAQVIFWNTVCDSISRWKEPRTKSPYTSDPYLHSVPKKARLFFLFFCQGWPTKLGKLDKFLRNEKESMCILSDLFNIQSWDLSCSCSHWIFTAFTHQLGHTASLFSLFVVELSGRCCIVCSRCYRLSIDVGESFILYWLHFCVGLHF